jgi:hypothetical protein
MKFDLKRPLRTKAGRLALSTGLALGGTTVALADGVNYFYPPVSPGAAWCEIGSGPDIGPSIVPVCGSGTLIAYADFHCGGGLGGSWLTNYWCTN